MPFSLASGSAQGTNANTTASHSGGCSLCPSLLVVLLSLSREPTSSVSRWCDGLIAGVGAGAGGVGGGLCVLLHQTGNRSDPITFRHIAS